jgi:ribosomal protein S20
MRGANKGVVHANLVARKLSRLAHRIKLMPS